MPRAALIKSEADSNDVSTKPSKLIVFIVCIPIAGILTLAVLMAIGGCLMDRHHSSTHKVLVV